MTFLPAVSVIVVSRSRPRMLDRTIKALQQQTCASFELVVVSDQFNSQDADLDLRYVFFDEANVAAARNAGLVAASGEIIAFCDDDSAPEPTWLQRIVQPFENEKVGTAGGYVLGRNGVEYQSMAVEIDAEGNDGTEVFDTGIYAPKAGGALKTTGTNCAFRRTALRESGGFDPAFRYFLDEADVNWRLARAGWHGAVVATALVHHDFAANASRLNNRAPTDLYEIAASKAVFLTKHCKKDHRAVLDAFRIEQMAKVTAAFDLGLLDAGQVRISRQTFEAGLKNGRERQHGQFIEIGPAAARTPLKQAENRRTFALCGGSLQSQRLRVAGKKLVAQGANVTIICLSLTALAMRVRFSPDGIWVHRGGVYGRLHRAAPIWRFRFRKNRIVSELMRIADTRHIDFVAWVKKTALKKRLAIENGLEEFETVAIEEVVVKTTR